MFFMHRIDFSIYIILTYQKEKKCKTYPLCFTKIHFSSLTFKFIQLRLFHQLLLYVVVNFPIFKIFLMVF